MDKNQISLKLTLLLLGSVSVFGSLSGQAQESAVLRPSRTYHQVHRLNGLFNVSQCQSCHPQSAEHTAPLNRSHCETCHSPRLYEQNQPGYAQNAPDSCIWCHSRTRNLRPSHHEYAHHRNCLNCHNDQHRNTLPRRTECLSCHRDHSNHFPDAPFCYACHTFSTRIDPTDPIAHGAPIPLIRATPTAPPSSRPGR